ncbi:hypothetical protein K491DRAFT_762808 [Lophiostoma macrostomum CBS 122681]|uniref:F-box domain-containing protein n=1 Tax=Lophiostoma macrostomum CBS 122681 TaxID=1314788 RepID=A0A6A6SPA3_9PLEO|nr:hypothetical protein K491DRAFT_762808 [Lophiostoma macrostomum CBS 122681]
MIDPSVPPPRPSLLLSLPREVRDEIYKFTLTEEEGLFSMAGRNAASTEPIVFYSAKHGKVGLDYNQLRYVCWQMHHETRSLLLHLNDLHSLDSPNHGTGKVHFYNFLASCSPTSLSQLRHITVPTRSDRPFSRVDGKYFYNIRDVITPFVEAFARTHPKCKVTVMITWGCDHDKPQAAKECIEWGAILQLMIRNTLPSHIIDRDRVGKLQAHYAAIVYGHKRIDNPGNIRLLPREGRFTEEHFREQCEWENPVMAERWTAQYRHWSKNGF